MPRRERPRLRHELCAEAAHDEEKHDGREPQPPVPGVEGPPVAQHHRRTEPAQQRHDAQPDGPRPEAGVALAAALRRLLAQGALAPLRQAVAEDEEGEQEPEGGDDGVGVGEELHGSAAYVAWGPR